MLSVVHRVSLGVVIAEGKYLIFVNELSQRWPVADIFRALREG
jgi:hypothetical protein